MARHLAKGARVAAAGQGAIPATLFVTLNLQFSIELSAKVDHEHAYKQTAHSHQDAQEHAVGN